MMTNYFHLFGLVEFIETQISSSAVDVSFGAVLKDSQRPVTIFQSLRVFSEFDAGLVQREKYFTGKACKIIDR